MAYFKRGALIERLTSTATAAGTTTLTTTSTTFQQFTGTQSQTVVLPDATTMDVGQVFIIENRSTGLIKVNKNGGALLTYLAPDSERELRLTDKSSAAGVWDISTSEFGSSSPMRMYSANPADSKIYFSANKVLANDGSELSTGPVKSTIPDVPATTIDFQTGAVTGGTVDIALPTTTIGEFRRVGFTLQSTGTITALFSDPVAIEGNLANPGTLFLKVGTPIGWIDLEATAATAFKTIGSASDVIEANVNGTARIHRFGAGSGGGSGSGVSSVLDPESESKYVYHTRSDFDPDGDTYVDSITGAVDKIIAEGAIEFTAASQEVLSTNLAGPSVRDDAMTINQVEATLLYDIVSPNVIDPSPTVEITRTGGSAWTTADVEALENTGNKLIAVASFGSDDTFDGDGTRGTTSQGQRIAAIFTPSYDYTLNSFQLLLGTTAVAGTVVGKVYSVSGGVPDTLLATSAETFTPGADITSTRAFKTFSFSPLTLIAGTAYALVAEGASLGGPDLVTEKVTDAGAFSTGSATHNGTSWSGTSDDIAFNTTGTGCDLRVKITSSAASLLKGFGVDYVLNNAAGITGAGVFEERTITAGEDSSGILTFNVIRYTPGEHQLEAHFQNKVYTARDFTELSPTSIDFGSLWAQNDVVRFFVRYGLVDGTSKALSKINAQYDAIIGTPAQYAAGVATHTTYAAAENDVPADGTILWLKGSYTENVTQNKRVFVEGQGYGTQVSGTWSVSSAASKGVVRDLWIGDNISFGVGTTGCRMTVFQATGKTATYETLGNSVSILRD